MKPVNPQQSNFGTPQGVLRWSQSIFKTLTGGISLAQSVSTDASGTPNTFVPDNGNGTMIRVGAAGDSSNAVTWSSGGTVTINHQLVNSDGSARQPIGFHIVDSSGQCSVWRTATSTKTQIQLQTSSPSVANTFYIF